jgi:chemotaxis signal transduction protein
MIAEETGTSDAALCVPATALLMSPTQALTAGFTIDAGNTTERSETKSGKPGGISPLVSSESRQGFRIGELRLMIRYEDAGELSEMTAIRQLPNAPDWFCGITNLNGKLIPVFDLASYIGIDPDPDAKQMLLVLSRGSDATGVIIDGLPVRLRWLGEKYSGLEIAPKRMLPHLRGASLSDGELWFDLDTLSLLAEIERSIGLK